MIAGGKRLKLIKRMCNKITDADKSNSIENQLKIIYYAVKDFTINIKATEYM